MKSKKIAGISVNLDALPTEERLIELALNTKEYIYKRNALELIKKEIKASGIYRSNTKQSKKTKGKRSKIDKRENRIESI